MEEQSISDFKLTYNGYIIQFTRLFRKMKRWIALTTERLTIESDHVVIYNFEWTKYNKYNEKNYDANESDSHESQQQSNYPSDDNDAHI